MYNEEYYNNDEIFSADYARLSADYCHDLFKVAELFFKSNVVVEDIVSSAKEDNFNPKVIIDSFSECEKFSHKCQETLEKFSEIHINYPGDKLDIDFQDQKNRLKIIQSDLNMIVNMFKSIDGNKSLQSQIWALDDFTRLFIKCARSIGAAIEWQCDFAERANLSDEQS